MANTAESKNTGSFTPAPENAKIDDKVVKKLAGEALAGIKGVLGVKGGLTDLLKDDDDPTRGVSVSVTEDQQVSVSAKIITEAGKNIPDIVNKATDAITQALQKTAGLKVKDICVEVTDTMTQEEYKQQGVDPAFIPPAGMA